MTWEDLVNEAIEADVKFKIQHYGEGMFTLSVGIVAEGDLTEEEAKVWFEEQLKK